MNPPSRQVLHTDTVNSVVQNDKSSFITGGISRATLITPTGSRLASNAEQQENLVGGSSSMKPPSRQVLHTDIVDSVVQNDESGFVTGGISSVEEPTGEEIVTLEDEGDTQEEECSMTEAVLQDIEGQREKQGTNWGGDIAPYCCFSGSKRI